jgi:SWI/SNF-related matrix-associated actin-dependent regulator of chromatin subfamily A3
MESRTLFKKFEEEGANDGETNHYANVIEVLMRMRQVCNHKDLIGDRELVFINRIRNGDVQDLDWNDPALQNVIALLRQNEGDDCPICLEPLHEPAITKCCEF